MSRLYGPGSGRPRNKPVTRWSQILYDYLESQEMVYEDMCRKLEVEKTVVSQWMIKGVHPSFKNIIKLYHILPRDVFNKMLSTMLEEY